MPLLLGQNFLGKSSRGQWQVLPHVSDPSCFAYPTLLGDGVRSASFGVVYVDPDSWWKKPSRNRKTVCAAGAERP